MTPTDTKIDLSEHIDFEAHYRKYGVAFDQPGQDQLTGRCPWHDDQISSFSVERATGLYHCFAGCGDGNILTFHQKVKGLATTKEAFLDLCREYNIPLSGKGPRNGKPRKQPPPDHAPVKIDISGGATPADKPPAPQEPDKVIPEETLALFPKFNDAWYAALHKLRKWSRETIDFLDLRLQTHRRDRKTGQVKPLPRKATPDRVVFPIRDEKGRLRNLRLYRPAGEKVVNGKTLPKIYSWGEGYGESRLFPEPSRWQPGPVYLVEGEPDLVCALSHGLNAVTTTGKARRWPKELVEPFAGRDVVACYDADRPGQLEYLAKAAINLCPIVKSFKAVVWPDFMYNDTEKALECIPGKVFPKKHGYDITDFFVRFGKTLDDFNALEFHEYQAPLEAQKKFKERIDRAPAECFNEPPPKPTNEHDNVIVWKGCFYQCKINKRTEAYEPVQMTDFNIEILRIYRTKKPNNKYDTEHLLRLTPTNDGIPPTVVQATTRQMSSKVYFCDMLKQVAGINWIRGGNNEFELMMNLVHLATPVERLRPVDLTSHVGWMKEHDMWLFADKAVKRGRTYHADPDGIIDVNGKPFKPNPLSDDGVIAHIPQLRHDISDERTDIVRKRMVELLKTNIGSYTAWMILGYVPACVYSQEIFDKFKFPILFIMGQRMCGKNTAGNVLFAHFGQDESIAENIHKATNVALNRRLEFSGACPVWVEEYRSNEQASARMDPILRSAYDRIGGSKGRIDRGVNNTIVRAPLVITGESVSQDSALSSRCIELLLNPRLRVDKVYPEILALQPELSAITYRMIKEKNPNKVAHLLEEIGYTSQNFIKSGVPSRIATAWAVVAESFAMFYGPEAAEMEGDQFLEWVMREAHGAKDTADETFALEQFWENLEMLRTIASPDFKPSEYIKIDEADGKVFLWIAGLHALYAQLMRRRGEEPWGRRDLQNYISQEPYFVSHANREYIGAVQKRATVLSFKHMPEDLRQMFTENFTGKIEN